MQSNEETAQKNEGLEEENTQRALPSNRFQLFFIFVCWLVYIIAQLGRYSVNANTTLLMDKYGIDHAEVSLPATMFFFSYGAGQIIVGLICGKYNKRIILSLALILSAVVNLLIFFGIDFRYVKYLWFLNGFAQANLWPSLLLALSQNVEYKRMPMVAIVMATASVGGRFLAYGVSAAFSVNKSLFEFTFLTGALALLGTMVVWYIASGKMVSYAPEKTRKAEEPTRKDKKRKLDKKTIIMLLVFGEFSFAAYGVSGGLQQWVPSILKEIYNLEDWLAIFTSVALPLFMLSAAFIADKMYKMTKSFVLNSMLMFVVCVGGITVTLTSLALGASWVAIIALFVMICISMSVVSNQTTVQAPLILKGKLNAGFLAGIFNGCCYFGSAVSSYGLGKIADLTGGWDAVFIAFALLAAMSAVLATVYLVAERLGKKR
ncbi:MAG: MFS transporter [Clostridia bacterium]|nr:MFS transporter [Clostridia bacterium]